MLAIDRFMPKWGKNETGLFPSVLQWVMLSCQRTTSMEQSSSSGTDNEIARYIEPED
jgi:hypothetical protein